MSALKKVSALALFVLVAVGAWARACLGAPASPLELVVYVRDDSGEALAEVPVLLSGRALGVTDGQGRLVRSLALGPAAQQVQAQCPEAYRTAAPRTLDLAGLRPRGGARFDLAVLLARGTARFDGSRREVALLCRPRLRTIALVVHAPSASGLTLRADHKPVGRLDEDGVLHVILRRPPGAKVALTLDPRAPALPGPAQTSTLFVEDRDRVVLFEPEP